MLVCGRIFQDLLSMLILAFPNRFLRLVQNLHHDGFVVLGLLDQNSCVDKLIKFLHVNASHSVHHVATVDEKQAGH